MHPGVSNRGLSALYEKYRPRAVARGSAREYVSRSRQYITVLIGRRGQSMVKYKRQEPRTGGSAAASELNILPRCPSCWCSGAAAFIIRDPLKESEDIARACCQLVQADGDMLLRSCGQVDTARLNCLVEPA